MAKNVKKVGLVGAYSESKVKTKFLCKNDSKSENEAVTLVNVIGPKNTRKPYMEGNIRSKSHKTLEHVPTSKPKTVSQTGEMNSRPVQLV